MKNKKLISRFSKILICSFLSASLNAVAQNNNQNQNKNAGTTNQQNNNINTPPATLPVDSLSRIIDNGNIPPPENAQQQQQRVHRQSGQNQVIIPPNAAGPDTNIHRITQDGNFNNNASDTTIQKKYNRNIPNTTLTDSARGTLPAKRDTIQ